MERSRRNINFLHAAELSSGVVHSPRPATCCNLYLGLAGQQCSLDPFQSISFSFVVAVEVQRSPAAPPGVTGSWLRVSLSHGWSYILHDHACDGRLMSFGGYMNNVGNSKQNYRGRLIQPMISCQIKDQNKPKTPPKSHPGGNSRRV